MAETPRIECDRCHKSIFTKQVPNLEGTPVAAPIVVRVIVGVVPGADEVDLNQLMVPEHLRDVIQHNGRLDLCVPCYIEELGPTFTGVPPTISVTPPAPEGEVHGA